MPRHALVTKGLQGHKASAQNKGQGLTTDGFTTFSGVIGSELPDGWQLRRLGELVERPQYGLTASATGEPKGPRFLRITDIQESGVVWETVPYCKCDARTAERLRLWPGDVVLARIGATTGKAYLIRDEVDAVFASYLIRLQVKNELASDFLEFFANSESYWRQIDSVKGGRLKQGVNIPLLESLEIPLPPLPEQRAIAEVLRTVQRAKEATEKVIAATRQFKASLMKHLFSYGPVSIDQADRVPVKETEIGPMPTHWRIVLLKDLLREPLRNGHSAKPTNSSAGIRTLTLTAVTQNNFSIENTKVTDANPERVREMWLRSGDIFIERANTADYVGLAALYEGNDDFAIFPDLLVRVRVDEGRVATKFLAEFLLTPVSRGYYRMNAKKTAGNFPKIDQGIIEKTVIVLPPLSEQREIATQLAAVDAKVAAEEKRRGGLNALFKSLLHYLMTGKVRVKDLTPPGPEGEKS